MADSSDIPKVPEMVERIARRILINRAYQGTADSLAWHLHVAEAREYLAALREPTEAMLDAPWRAQPSVQLYEPTDLTQVLDCVSFERVWQAMIDAALGG